MVIWIIGLSGSGKTTLANEVVTRVKDKLQNVVLIDGDAIRELFGNDLGYTVNDRLKNAERISNLCKFLDEQDINVVCAILSIFPESRSWNRKNIKNYYEVFIDSPLPTLISRDSKGIYGKYNRGELKGVAGIDIEFPVPEHADLVINNSGTKEELLNYSSLIINSMIDNQ